MKPKRPKHLRVLAIAPSYRGFGFAVLDGHTLVDWGVKVATGDKNAQSLSKVERIVAHYDPDVVALEDCVSESCRRAPRTRALIQLIADMASSRGIQLEMFSRQQITEALCAGGRGSKDALAEALAKRFPEELGFRVPPKRRPWDSEDYRMNIFDAVAFALMALLE